MITKQVLGPHRKYRIKGAQQLENLKKKKIEERTWLKIKIRVKAEFILQANLKIDWGKQII